MKSLAAASSPITVLIADSSRMQCQLLTAALRRRPELHIHSCRMDAPSILQAVTLKTPTVALLAVNFSVALSEPLMTLRRFNHVHPDIPKVLLVESFDRDLVVKAFRSGARGIFSITDSSLRLLCKCILQVSAGQVWANAEQLTHLLELVSEAPAVRVLSARGNTLLTPREEQVVALVTEGLGNRQIARELNLSEHTIKKYLFRIFEKLGVSSRVELVLYALHNGETRHPEWLTGSQGILPSA